PQEGRAMLDAELVLAFQPGGWGIKGSILLRRGPGMPEEIAVSFGSGAHELCGIGDDFYEPLALADTGEALAQGIAAEAGGDAACRWVRGGRSLHVFTARTGVAGFVSTARIVIGQENAILCTSEIAEEALRACTAAGCALPAEVLGPGVPV